MRINYAIDQESQQMRETLYLYMQVFIFKVQTSNDGRHRKTVTVVKNSTEKGIVKNLTSNRASSYYIDENGKIFVHISQEIK